MLKFGIAGKPSTSKNLEQGMSLLNKLELDALELQFGRGLMLGDMAIERITKAAQDNGISLSCHAPYYINLNSEKPETIEKSKKWITDTLEIAMRTDSTIIVVHAGRRDPDTPSAATPAILEGLAPVLDWMDSNGCAGPIGLETMGKERTWGGLDEIKEVCKTSKHLVPVIDFAHIHALHQGLFKTQRDYEKILTSYEETGLDFLHCHFTCIEYGEKGEKKHLPISARDPDFIPLAKAFKKKKYPITLICESPLLEKDALLLKDWFNSL